MASIIKIAILVSLFGIIFVSGLPYHGGANGLAQRQSPNRKHTHFSYHRYHPNTGDLGKRDASGHGKCRPKSQVSTPEKVSTIKHAATASNEAIVNVASTVHTAKKSQETHKSAPPTSSNPSNSTNANGQGSYSGDGTFYATGLDACGWIDKDTAHICAVSHILFEYGRIYFPCFNMLNLLRIQHIPWRNRQPKPQSDLW
jgi:hypothetical protein